MLYDKGLVDMAQNVLSIATREINKGIKDDRTLILGTLMYYRNLLDNIALEMYRIESKINELLEERKRRELENDKKIDLLLEERKRMVSINQRQMDALLGEKHRKMEQFENAPKKIEELNEELEGLGPKRSKLMIVPLRKQLKKLRKELEGIEAV